MAQVATTIQATWNQSPAVGVVMAAAATRFHAVSYIVASAMMMVQPSCRGIKTADVKGFIDQVNSSPPLNLHIVSFYGLED